MFINRLFRERALARRGRQEPLDDRLQVTAPHEWLLVIGLGAMFVALLVYLAVGSVERSLSYEAVVVLPGERFPVSAPVPGTVVETLADVGDTVEAGQAIARLRPLAPDASAAAADVDVVSVTGGEIMTLDAAPGMPVSAGEPVALVRVVAPGPPEALALVLPGDARRLEAGMAAQVSVAGRNRDTGIHPAEVAAVSERAFTPPAWLEDLGMSASAPSHLVRVPLVSDGHGDVITDGSRGSLRVVLGRSSLLSLLAPGDGS
ncbi:MAG: biotin/lipoyl-binding protein [bacterium]|nr:biotin/lipoyl-binding protein [bacterium]